MLIYVDFDGTITPDHFPVPLESPPFKGVRDRLVEWRKAGHQIAIYSCRSNDHICDPRAEEEMKEYLIKWSIPYDFFVRGKPLFQKIIDDRAVGWSPELWQCTDLLD